MAHDFSTQINEAYYVNFPEVLPVLGPIDKPLMTMGTKRPSKNRQQAFDLGSKGIQGLGAKPEPEPVPFLPGQGGLDLPDPSRVSPTRSRRSIA